MPGDDRPAAPGIGPRRGGWLGGVPALRRDGVSAAQGSRSALRAIANGALLVAPVLAAGLAHVAVLKTGALAPLAAPLDGGRTLRGRPLLGRRKTWRGVLIMPVATACAASLEARLAGRRSPFGCCSPPAWLVGAALGLGYCAGELPNSFVKRQLGVPDGGTAKRLAGLQYAIDQSDSIVGCLVALRLVCRQPRADLVAAAGLGIAAHVAVDRLMVALGLRGRAR